MFDEIPKIKSFFSRSVSIHHTKTFIYGPPQSGKTTLALWHARQFQHIFYIDSNMLFSKDLWEQTKQTLRTLTTQLELLIIDNITLATSAYINDIVVSCPCIYIGKREACPTHFVPLRMLPLSFEEYLGIDKKKLSVESLLSNFIKDGNTPEMLLLADYKKCEYKWRAIQVALQDDMLAFSHMLALQALKTSINGIYTHLKKYIKISKDRIYPFIRTLEANGIIHICQHVDICQEIHKKKCKLYFYDFSLAADFAYSKHFMRVYENMIFLELLSMGFILQYSDYCDFIDIAHKRIFFCMPFASTESIIKKIALVRKKEKQYNDYTLFAITMSYHYMIDAKAMIIDFANLSLHLRIP